MEKVAPSKIPGLTESKLSNNTDLFEKQISFPKKNAKTKTI